MTARSCRGGLCDTPERRVAHTQFELREIPNGTGGSNLKFTGYASVTGVAYEMEDAMGPWTESVERGSFRNVIADRQDVAFLINHEGMTLARTKSGTLRLAEDSTGLHSEALLDLTNPVVVAVRSAVERGDLDEMSMTFRVTQQRWSDDWSRRWIQLVDMNSGDVSLVNYGANVHTAGLVAVRRAPGLRKTPATASRKRGHSRRKTLAGWRAELELIKLKAGADRPDDQLAR